MPAWQLAVQRDHFCTSGVVILACEVKKEKQDKQEKEAADAKAGKQKESVQRVLN